MKTGMLAISFFLVLPTFAQPDDQLIGLGEIIHQALVDEDEALFVSAYPDREQVETFLRADGQEPTTGQIDTTANDLLSKAKANFKALTTEAKANGIIWSEMERLQITHDEVDDQTFRVNIYVILQWGEKHLQLVLDDVVKLSENTWRLTDEVKVNIMDP